MNEAEAEKPLNPWFSIWFHPRRTVRALVEADPGYRTLFIAVTLGASQGAISVTQNPALPQIPSIPLLSIGILLGALFGILFLYYFGGLYRWMGSWLGGTANGVSVRTALAWAEVPIFANVAVWGILYLGTQRGWVSFISSGLGNLAASLVFPAWSFVLVCHTVGEVHGFSAWRGLLTSILVFLFNFLLIFGTVALLAVAVPTAFRGRLLRMPRIPLPVKVSAPKLQVPYKEQFHVGERVTLKLKDGRTLAGVVLDESREAVYLETDGRIMNVFKRDLAD